MTIDVDINTVYTTEKQEFYFADWERPYAKLNVNDLYQKWTFDAQFSLDT